ncbi:MAG: WD40 repeat domain-containing protein, partial [Planctomycetota bacterium JB042]
MSISRPLVRSRSALAPALVAALLPGLSRAAEVMTPDHVAKLRGVTSAAIAPDGSSVAYTLSVPRIPNEDENGSAWTELHVVDRDGKSRGFVTGEVNVSRVSWRPGHDEIAFTARRGDDDHTALWVISTHGGEARKLLEHDASIGDYSFSPDGTRVAFLARDEAPKRAKDLKKKGFDAEVVEEELRFSRVWIAEPGNSDWEPRKLEIEGNPSELHWSPAGGKLAMALAPTPLVDDSYMAKKVSIVDVATGKLLHEYDNPGKLGQIAWSPDGKKIACISAEDIHDPSEGRLMVADASGGRLVDVFPNFMGHVTTIAWSDADTITFLTDQGTSSSVERISADGSNHVTVFPAGRAVLAGLTLSKDGRQGALRSESPNHPPEVYAMNEGAKFARRLTNVTWFEPSAEIRSTDELVPWS